MASARLMNVAKVQGMGPKTASGQELRGEVLRVSSRALEVPSATACLKPSQT